MTTFGRAISLRRPLARLPVEQAVTAGVCVGASVIAGAMVASPSLLRLGFAGCVAALVVGLGLKSPRPLLYAIIGWLATLGLIRRLLSIGFTAGGPADPLLLVYPLALIVLVLAAADAGAFRRRTSLGTAVLVLVVLVLLGALNPLQGSLLAGLSALVFFVQLLAFWVGRGLGDERTMRRTLLVVALASVPAALYGMYQISTGFPPWDQQWIDASGYTALQVGSAMRPFSSFSSASEYATFLSVAIVVWLALGRRFVRPLALAATALLVVSVVYQSSRGSVVTLLAALAILLAARRRVHPILAIAGAAVLLALLPVAVQRFAPSTFGTDAKSQLIAHQVEGLSNPFDPEASTVGAHISLIFGGIKEGFRTPIGNGISSVTIAGSKFDGRLAGGTEADPSNAAVALGLPGLLAYFVVLGLGLTKAYTLAVRTREPLALVALGVLVVTFPQWLNGGQYAVALIPWLLLGWVDRRAQELDTAEVGASGAAERA